LAHPRMPAAAVSKMGSKYLTFKHTV
jgi:hypothetical protein